MYYMCVCMDVDASCLVLYCAIHSSDKGTARIRVPSVA